MTPWDHDENSSAPQEIIDWLDRDDVWKYLQPNSAGMAIMGLSVHFPDDFLDSALNHHASLGATHLLIGLRLYEMENGHLPDQLQELVPDFIEELPVDPFSGNPFRYDKERKLVLSIGIDRQDQNASLEAREGLGHPVRRETHCKDHVYSLRKSFEELRDEPK